MKRLVIFSVAGICFFLLWGCRVRTYTVEKPRVDLEITGNQGYLQGQGQEGQAEKRTRLGPTRKISVVEVELKEPKTEQEVDTAPVEVQETALDESIILEEPESFVLEEEIEEDAEYAPAEKAPEYKIYTVEKNDTLQKISYKFYNTTRRWEKIYKANKDVLKGPDKIYPGQVLKIPVE
ncbi:MAG: LysM peptidoglycan-binding domain-containing protein [Candidatus Omnitrophica bacterium]|nr:LysM peptidoglycan-binding domain-containing protein [Candidatus Omnitrophota bacterium]